MSSVLFSDLAAASAMSHGLPSPMSDSFGGQVAAHVSQSPALSSINAFPARSEYDFFLSLGFLSHSRIFHS